MCVYVCVYEGRLSTKSRSVSRGPTGAAHLPHHTRRPKECGRGLRPGPCRSGRSNLAAARTSRRIEHTCPSTAGRSEARAAQAARALQVAPAPTPRHQPTSVLGKLATGGGLFLFWAASMCRLLQCPPALSTKYTWAGTRCSPCRSTGHRPVALVFEPLRPA